MAQSNKKWMIARGAIEKGEEHYILFILLHVLFFLFLAAEFILTDFESTLFFNLLMTVVGGLQVLRIWCIRSLGRRWNTRIIFHPDEEPIKRGPYRFLKHPNYTIVFLELLFIPLLFQAYFTAVLFPILHLIVLKIRIPMEESSIYERS